MRRAAVDQRLERAVDAPRRRRGASPSETSSSSSSRGLVISARPIAVACCSPPERLAARLPAQRLRASGTPRAPRRRVHGPAAARRRATQQVLLDGQARRTAAALRGRARSRARHAGVRRSARDVGAVEDDAARRAARCAPAIVRSSVVLPAPLAPTSATVSPSATSKRHLTHRLQQPVARRRAPRPAAARHATPPSEIRLDDGRRPPSRRPARRRR